MRPTCVLAALTTVAVAVLALAFGACRPTPPARQFAMRGQVLAVRPDGSEIVIRHENIKDFMPAMTMPFKVRDKRLLAGRVAGDLVAGTLVVTDDESYLSSLQKVGFAEVVHTAPPTPVVPALNIGDTVPDVTLVDQDARPFSLASLRGRVVAVTFIYTRCPLPEFCPLMERLFAAVQKGVKTDAHLRKNVHLLSVSFDPDYDTPAVLKEQAGRVGADQVVWTHLTGDRQAIDRLTAALGVMVIHEDDSPGGITHSMRTVILDREGRLATAYNGNGWTAEQMLGSLRQAVDAR
jgi:protein SCO1/2